MAMNMASLMLGNLFGGGGRRSSSMPDTSNQTTALVAARADQLKKQKDALAGAAGMNSMVSTGPLGLPGNAGTPTGYKTLLGS